MTAQPGATTRWTDERLDSMRQVMDPPADDAVRELFEEGEIGAVNNLMAHLIKNDEMVPNLLRPSIRAYLEHSAGLPEWADPEQIAIAEQFFGDYGLPICLSLMCGSLPESYAGAKGVEVLYMTARLETDTKRRIGETAQMIINVMAPGGLASNGQGISDTRRVRLMHAAIRHLIANSGRWDPAFGQPINQEDLAGTLMTFTVTILDSLKKLGVKVEPREAEAYLHAWKVVGHMLGILPEMLPENVADAEELMGVIRRRQFAPSEAGRAMTSALIEMLEDQVPGTIFKAMPATMIRHLLGDEVSDIIGAPKGDWTQKLIGRFGTVFNIAEDAEDRSVVLRKAGDHFTRAFLEGMAWIDRGGHRAPFSIPTVLQQRWQMKPHSGQATTAPAGTGDDAPIALRILPRSIRARLFPWVGVASLVLIVPLIVLTRSLSNPTATQGIVSFELAGSVPRASEIIGSWSQQDQLRAALSLGFDPLFLIAYSTAMAIACFWAADAIRERKWRIASAGVALGWGQWLAMLFAAIQDGALSTILLGQVREPWPQVASWFAVPKYALLALGLGFVLVASVSWIVHRISMRLKH